jgi:hypothetical protein
VPGPAVARFVLLTTQRTGSSWLTTLLDSHPDADAYGELCLPGEGARPPWGARHVERFWSARGRLAESGPVPRRPRATFSYLDYLFASNPEARAVGFKLMYDQAVKYPEILVYCMRKRVRVIHLIRPNVLDMVISRELMVARGEAHATSADEVAPARVTLDPSSIRRRLQLLELETASFRNALRALRLRRLEVAYDALVSDGRTLEAVLQFLDLPPGAELESPLVKVNDRRQSELVENYAAVSKSLRGTRYAAFLTG